MKNSKLLDKASRLDFSRLPGTAPASPDAATPAPPVFTPRPKTAPGALMAFANDTRSELLKENETLRERAQEAEVLRSRLDEALDDLQQWEGAKASRLIEASLVRPSRFANRHPGSFQDADYLKLRHEIQDAGGNVQPIKVRPVRGEEDSSPVRYEVVFGHRRLRACQELGLPVLAMIDNLDDQALFVEMERENRARKDLSAWEQGMMYRSALDSGLFPSNRKLAEAIGVDLSALGKALSLAALPEFIVAAFPSPLTLQFRWAKPLSDALAADAAGMRERVLDLQALPQKLSAREVFERLVDTAPVERRRQGVEPFHPPAARRAIRLGRHEVGSIGVDAQGRIDLTLQPQTLDPDGDALDALARLIAEFLATRAGGRGG